MDWAKGPSRDGALPETGNNEAALELIFKSAKRKVREGAVSRMESGRHWGGSLTP